MHGYRVRTTKCRGALSHIRADKIFSERNSRRYHLAYSVYTRAFEFDLGCWYTGYSVFIWILIQSPTFWRLVPTDAASLRHLTWEMI